MLKASVAPPSPPPHPHTLFKLGWRIWCWFRPRNRYVSIFNTALIVFWELSVVLSSEEHLQAAGLIQSDAPNWGFVKKKIQGKCFERYYCIDMILEKSRVENRQRYFHFVITTNISALTDWLTHVFVLLWRRKAGQHTVFSMVCLSHTQDRSRSLSSGLALTTECCVTFTGGDDVSCDTFLPMCVPHPVLQTHCSVSQFLLYLQHRFTSFCLVHACVLKKKMSSLWLGFISFAQFSLRGQK